MLFNFSKIITDPFSICNYKKKNDRIPYWAEIGVKEEESGWSLLFISLKLM